MVQGAGVFENKPSKSEVETVAAQEDLVKTIGHQTTQIGWLKKS